VMLQRIPETLGPEAVRWVLDSLGFAGSYDTVHVPLKRGLSLSLRYAFVNFRSPEDAARCIRMCTGKPFGDTDAGLICTADYSRRQAAELRATPAADAGSKSRGKARGKARASGR